MVRLPSSPSDVASHTNERMSMARYVPVATLPPAVRVPLLRRPAAQLFLRPVRRFYNACSALYGSVIDGSDSTRSEATAGVVYNDNESIVVRIFGLHLAGMGHRHDGKPVLFPIALAGTEFSILWAHAFSWDPVECPKTPQRYDPPWGAIHLWRFRPCHRTPKNFMHPQNGKSRSFLTAAGQ